MKSKEEKGDVGLLAMLVASSRHEIICGDGKPRVCTNCEKFSWNMNLAVVQDWLDVERRHIDPNNECFAAFKRYYAQRVRSKAAYGDNIRDLK